MERMEEMCLIQGMIEFKIKVSAMEHRSSIRAKRGIILAALWLKPWCRSIFVLL